MIKVKMLRAQDGDSFLLHFGIEAEFNMLIDMGRRSTYVDFIRDELIALHRKQRKLDLLVITHIDEDHIEGALPFLEENGSGNMIIEVGEVWHNTYRHLQFSKPKSSSVSNEERGALQQLINQNSSDRYNEGWRDISVKSGVSLGGLILKNKYNWNRTFSGLAACTENQPEHSSFPIKFTLLSPGNKELKELGRAWENKLRTIFYDFQLSDETIFDDAFEYVFKKEKDKVSSIAEIAFQKKTIEDYAIVEMNDSSKVNASSIAFIIEYDGKRLLFLGDATSDRIASELKSLNNGNQCYFDLVKISHHGSARNTSIDLLKLIDAKKYLISTNGLLHNHPAMETVAKLLIKPSAFRKELYFNYKIKGLEWLESKEIQDKYNFSINYCNEIEL